MKRRTVLLGIGAGALAAPWARAAGAGYADVTLEGVPHVRQRPDFCGEACIAMWLARMGHDVDQDEVFARTGIDPAEGRGAWTREMKVALEALGFDPAPVWSSVKAGDGDAIEAEWGKVHADLIAGVPSILCTHYDESPRTTEHFRLILGYDADRDEVLFHDPAEKDGAYLRMSRARLERLWPLKYRRDAWTLIRMPLRATDGLAVAVQSSQGSQRAALTQKVMDLDVPEGFTLVVEPPFVVLGDEAPERVRQRAASTVRWSVQRLKRQFFAKDPDAVWEIWLFDGEKSYRHWAWKRFGDRPDTPYGYATSAHNALVMNIATGGGTLVHEIVHPFMDANFPRCPSWFNEGLASLYEQSSSRGAKIVGLTNWRLHGLQEAIVEGELPSFEALTSTSRSAFYNRDPGTNYAQARYLMYWLQEEGRLERFYRAFTAAARTDPTGYATLTDVIGTDDMTKWQADWEAWVLGLRFG